jgi:enoyl-CoA hydratase
MKGMENTVSVILTTPPGFKQLVATIDDGKANALSLEVIEGLRSAVATACADMRTLVIVGRDGQFCAGFDLSVMRGGDAAEISSLLTEGGKLFREILEVPIPVIAACTGHALAGGALILLACDYRVGCQGAFKIGLNEVRIGMPLPTFALAMARHRIAVSDLTSATLFGEIYDPDDATTTGYLDTLDRDPLARSLSVADRLANLPQVPFSVTKRRLREPLLTELAHLGL